MKKGTVTKASVLLAKKLIKQEPNRKILAERLEVSPAYISYLYTGKRIASLQFCKKVKKVYPDLESLCLAIQYKKVDLD